VSYETEPDGEILNTNKLIIGWSVIVFIVLLAAMRPAARNGGTLILRSSIIVLFLLNVYFSEGYYLPKEPNIFYTLASAYFLYCMTV
jgi:hypothetical protein